MIRTAVFAAALFAAASPALALEVTSAPAPKDENVASFINVGAVERLAPAGVGETYRFGDASGAHGPMVVREIAKGKPADHLDVNDPRDNPFMAAPERESDSAAAPASGQAPAQNPGP